MSELSDVALAGLDPQAGEPSPYADMYPITED
ncbi:hypothetical protein ABIA39_005279 [Nocardia sp. GAS34]